MPAPVRIRIGAGLDASVEQAFSSYEKRAARAAENAQRALNKRERKRSKSDRSGAAKAEADDEINQARRSARVREKLDKDSSRAALAEIRRQRHERAREHRELLREVEREERKASRERERRERVEARRRVQLERQSRRDLDRFATRTSHRTTRFLAPNMPIASTVRRGAMDLARGYGFETGLSGAFGRGIDLESRAVTLANQAYVEGAPGPAGVRQDPKRLVADAQAVGDALRIPYSTAMDALEAYVAKTGELAEGRDMLKELGAIAYATGSDFGDVADMAGDIGNALGNIPNKGQAILETVRQVVGATKVGTVEAKDFASQMAKIASAATAFEGDRQKNITTLSAFAQVARATGGASSASTAATAVARFADTLKTPSRVKEFKKQGVEVFNERGQIRDPMAILKESIAASKGDPITLKKMWSNVMGARAVEGFATAYRDAGGGKEGLAAIDKVMAKYLGAQMGKKEISESNRRRMETDAAKVQQFNNELEKASTQIRADLAPTIAELTPKVLELVGGFGNLVQWLLTNPGLAITGAITASIARAGLESTLRSGIESAIKGVANNKTISITGKLAAGATIAATAVTIAVAGIGAIDWGFTKIEKAGGFGKREIEKTRRETEFATAERLQREKGGITKERKEGLEKIVEEQQRRVVAAQELYAGPAKVGGKNVALGLPEQLAYTAGKSLYDIGRSFLGFEGGKTADQVSRALVDTGSLDAMKAELAQMNAQLRKLDSLHVTVDNANEIGVQSEGGVDPTGRER